MRIPNLKTVLLGAFIAGAGFIVPAYILYRSFFSYADGNAVAVVNGQPMSAAELIVCSSEITDFDHNNPEHLELLVRRAVENRALAAEAERLGLAQSDAEVVKRLEHERHFTEKQFVTSTLMGGLPEASYVSDEEFRRHVEEHKAALEDPEDVAFNLRRANSQAEVETILSKVDAGLSLDEIDRTSEPSEKGFVPFAEQHFLAPADVLDPRIRKAIWSAKVGQVVGPILADDELYFAQPTGRRAGRERTFESIHDKLYVNYARYRYGRDLEKNRKLLAEKYPAQIDQELIARVERGESVDGGAVVARVGELTVDLQTLQRQQASIKRGEERELGLPAVLERRLEGMRTLAFAKDRKVLQSDAAQEDHLAWRTLVLQQAMVQHLAATSTYDEAAVEAGLKRIQERYAANPHQVRVELLVLRDLQKAQSIHRRLQTGGKMEDFRAYTIVTGRLTDVGWFYPWELDVVVSDKLDRAQDRELVGPVESRLGFVLARILERRTAKLHEEELRAGLIAAERRRSAEVEEKRLRDAAWKDAKVEVDWDFLRKFWKSTMHLTPARRVAKVQGRSEASGEEHSPEAGGSHAHP